MSFDFDFVELQSHYELKATIEVRNVFNKKVT